MGWTQLKSGLELTLPSLGGFGLLLSAFIDSSFVPLPLLTDLFLMELCLRHPVRVPYYAGMAAVGSLGGCIWIYSVARRGGQLYYRKARRHAPGRIQRFVREHPVACVVLPAVAPFPVPFKPFVIAQGVFEVPFPTFVIGTLLGRGMLFFSEGFLSARYGAAAKEYLINQRWPSLVLALGLVSIFILIRNLTRSKKGVFSE